MRIQRGGTGGPDPPLKNHKYIGFLSNTGPDPLKISWLPSQHSMFGHHLHASETTFKWRFVGEPTMAPLKWYSDPLSLHQLKKIVKVAPPLTKFSGSAHGT